MTDIGKPGLYGPGEKISQTQGIDVSEIGKREREKQDKAVQITGMIWSEDEIFICRDVLNTPGFESEDYPAYESQESMYEKNLKQQGPWFFKAYFLLRLFGKDVVPAGFPYVR